MLPFTYTQKTQKGDKRKESKKRKLLTVFCLFPPGDAI